MAKITVVKEDITKMNVDAIVNAANTTLLAGAGVCGAIHRAAGPKLQDECIGMNGCSVGMAKITGGYNLPAKYVIHAVGPYWNGGNDNEDVLLRNAYFNSLSVAQQNNIQSIAFPNISTGIYHFPKERAAKIAVNTVNDFLEKNPYNISDVYFVCFDEDNYLIYTGLIK
jgi:O-acetyl-ADP-ribose deacetylase (regulator of RNase III)